MQDNSQQKSSMKITQCQLCCQEIPLYKMAKISLCSHIFCQLCLQEYIEQKLKNFQLIICPSTDCKAELDNDSGLIVTLTNSQKKKLKIIKFRRFVESNSWIICPDQKCHEGIIKKKEGDKQASCDKCLQIYCLKCMLPRHRGQCNNLQQKLLRLKFNFKKCPNCQRIVERSEGCRHMVCKCDFQFCYDCGNNWSYDHQCIRKNVKKQVQQAMYQEQPQYIDDKVFFLLRSTIFCCFGQRLFNEFSCGEKIAWIILLPLYSSFFLILMLLWILGCIFYSIFAVILLFPAYFIKIFYIALAQTLVYRTFCQFFLLILVCILFPPLILYFMVITVCDDFNCTNDKFGNELVAPCLKAEFKPIKVYLISRREKQNERRRIRRETQLKRRAQQIQRRKLQEQQNKCISIDKHKITRERRKRGIPTLIKDRRKSRKSMLSLYRSKLQEDPCSHRNIMDYENYQNQEELQYENIRSYGSHNKTLSINPQNYQMERRGASFQFQRKTFIEYD